MENRPALFIGSSKEAKTITEEIKNQLSEIADVSTWYEGDIFTINESYLSSLMTSNFKFDFSILVFSPDDDLKSRGKEVKTARDNIIFEMGLCLGRLGSRRAFLLMEESVNLPSDFKGIKLLKYKLKEGQPVQEALAPVCTVLKDIIVKQYKEPELGLLPSTALAIGYFENFLKKVCDALLSDEISELDIGDKKWVNNKKFVINVIIPETLAYLNPGQLKTRISQNNLEGVTIKTGSRPYPLYIKAGKEIKNVLELYDLPTTLYGSMLAIEKVIPNDFIGHKEFEDLLQVRELKNFHRAIEYYFSTKTNALYKEYIKVEYLKK